jgi:hypothetical protein
MQQLFIQLINCVWYLLHDSALNCHPQGAFLVPSERCSNEEQSIEYWDRRVVSSDVVCGDLKSPRFLVEHFSEGAGNAS